MMQIKYPSAYTPQITTIQTEKGQYKKEILNRKAIVKDDIEFAFGNTIPLWHFGFSY